MKTNIRKWIYINLIVLLILYQGNSSAQTPSSVTSTQHEYRVSKINGYQKVIRDTHSLLMWTPDIDVKGKNWEETKEKVDELNKKKYAGYNDWRMPNIEELKGIYDDKTQSKALDYSSGKTVGIDPKFELSGLEVWSNTLKDSEAYQIDFSNGKVKPVIKSDTDSDLRILAVRSYGNDPVHVEPTPSTPPVEPTPPPTQPQRPQSSLYSVSQDGRYQVYNSNGQIVIKDTVTGLMWTPDLGKDGLSWDVTYAWVEQLNQTGYGGYGDWRMPSMEELRGIFEKGKRYHFRGNLNAPMIAGIDPVFDFYGGQVWSSDLDREDPAYAKMFYFNRGFFDGANNLLYSNQVSGEEDRDRRSENKSGLRFLAVRGSMKPVIQPTPTPPPSPSPGNQQLPTPTPPPSPSPGNQQQPGSPPPQPDYFGVYLAVLLCLLIALLAIITIYFIKNYNALVSLNQLVLEAWSNIDTVLRRRYDLVSNLLEMVKGYAHHEKDTFERVAKARSDAMASSGSLQTQSQNEVKLGQELKSLFAVVENYPELKANQNFLKLHESLIDIEDKIQNHREVYNARVRTFNSLVLVFPSSLIANMVGFKPKEYFEISSSDALKPVIISPIS